MTNSSSLEGVGRFAPSITGQAHPGTLLAALLCWLDCRSRGYRIVLRLEDLDPQRLRPGLHELMCEALEWLGLDWDETLRQSDLRPQHEAALEELVRLGLVYPCSCSRSQRRASGRPAPGGGFAYDNRCRSRKLPVGGTQACKEPLRVRLPDDEIVLRDEACNELSQTPAHEVGDPVVRRREEVMSYHLVSVVDDASSGVTRVVRGRDLGASTATQIMLQRILGVSTPAYLHHFLLMEDGKDKDKLAKLHDSIGYRVLAQQYSAAEFCGRLAKLSGLRPTAEPCTPTELLPDFSWARVTQSDVTW